jgi:PAS domain S-box-containing protein
VAFRVSVRSRAVRSLRKFDFQGLALNLPAHSIVTGMLAEPQSLRILVVDDDRIDREIYKRCLKEIATPSFEFTEAESAAAGIELGKTWRPDCILLDYDLPDMNGLQVLAGFRTGGESLPCAVVMLTAFGGEGLAVQAMKAGVMDYLPKRQVSAESLAYTVTNAIQKFQMQRRIEEQRAALERSQRRYEQLLEAMPQMVWTANAEGRLEYANRRLLEYTGVTLETAGQLGWDQVFHPEDRELTRSAWQSAMESGSVFEIEHRLLRAADQCYRWHLVRAVPMKNLAGEVTNWFGTSTEVESQKQAEKAAHQKEKLETLGLLAGGIAHDFNNLLVSIVGGASFVMETLPMSDPASRSAAGILKDMIRAGERAADLTRKMLAYSGHGNFIVEPIDMDGLARQTCEFLSSSLPMSIHLRFEGGSQLPPVRTDAEQLRQVIVELVTNAVEAIGENASGAIRVYTRFAKIDEELARQEHLETAVAAGTKFVSLEVQDTGCGMDQETQAKIFDPFFSTKFTGRGLGLSAVYGFVRSNGGAVRVRSGPGEGAVFQVVLPAAEPHRQIAGEGH